MKTIVFVTLFLFQSLIHAQITFEKIMGGPLNEQANAILQEDGGYVIAGNTYSFGAGESDIYLVKTDEYGDTVWTKTYGDSAADYANALIEAGDGGYIIAGITETYDDQYSSIYLIKTDENGDSLWAKSYQKERYCRASDIKRTADGGYIVAGSVQKNRPETNDFLLLKTDSNGDSLWLRTYGGEERDGAVAVLQTADKGYIVTGFTESFGQGSEDIYTVKTDSNGIMIWDTTYGGTGKDIAVDIIHASDDGFMIAGYTNSYGAGYEDVYLIKINETGDTLWTKTYGGESSDYTRAIQSTTEGGYILAGNSNTYATEAWGYDAYAIKTDENGDTLWTRVFGGGSVDGFMNVEHTTDNGYVFVGYTHSFGAEGQDIYLIKTNELGMMTDISGKQGKIPLMFKLEQNYPNPFNPSTTIEFTLPGSEFVELKVYNILGKEVSTLVSNKLNQGNHIYTFDGKNLACGIYYYQLVAGDYREVKKMILLQ
jgi:hypothetical protein